ncbi:MAG: MFS transporter [Armatimonadota bacterium]|nr:MFS transporter [Armatimonadota bacterium]
MTASVAPHLGPTVRRHMRLLAAAQALSTATFQLVPALGGVMFLHLTGDVALTGLALSLSGLGQLLTAYPGGRLMDRLGRGPVFAGSAALAAVAAALVAWAFRLHVTWGVAAAILFLSAVAAPLRQLSVAAADMHPPEQRGRAVGLLFFASALGALISPVVSSVSARLSGGDVAAITWTWVVAALLQAAIVPLMRALRPDPMELGRLVRAEADSRAGKAESASLSLLPAAIATYAANWGVMTLSMAVAPVAMRAHGHGVSDIVWAIAVHSIGMFAFSVPLGSLADRVGRVPVMFGSLVASGLSAYGSVAFPAFWSATAFLFLVGVGWSAGVVASTALLSDLSSVADRGRRFGVAEFVARGAVLGYPVLGSVLAGRLGLAGVAAVLLASVAVPAWLIVRGAARARQTWSPAAAEPGS